MAIPIHTIAHCFPNRIPMVDALLNILNGPNRFSKIIGRSTFTLLNNVQAHIKMIMQANNPIIFTILII